MGYQKIDQRIWDDENFRQLSPLGKLVWMYLIVPPSSVGNFIGFYTLRPSAGAEDLEIELSEFNTALGEITKRGMATYDEENRVILVKNFLKYNPVGGNLQMKGVENALKRLPRTQLLYEFRDLLDQPQIRQEGRNEEIIEVVSRFLGTMNLEGVTPPTPTVNPEEKEPPVMVPLDGLVDVWNQICVPLLPQIMSLPPKRQNTIRARLKERPDLEEWKGIFQKIISSPFLRGENDKGWRADLDWSLNVNNLAKILEGKYDDRKNPNKAKTGMDAVRAMAEESLPRNQMGGADDEGDLSQRDGLAPEIF